MKILTIAALAGCMVAGPALAADLYVPPPAAPMMSPTPVYNWSGFYIGANVGYASADADAAFVTAPFAGIPITASPKGFLGGIQAGANFQTGNVVLGVQGALDAADINDTYADPTIGVVALGGGAAPGSTVTTKTDWTGSLLARAGYSFGAFLPYVTGGYVAAHVKTAATSGNISDDQVLNGWGLGVGLDMALDENWSAEIQYLHSELSGPNFYSGQPYENSANPKTNAVTAAINYKF